MKIKAIVGPEQIKRIKENNNEDLFIKLLETMSKVADEVNKKVV